MVAEVINPYTYQFLKSLTHSAVWNTIQYNTVVWYNGKENEQNGIEFSENLLARYDPVDLLLLLLLLLSFNRSYPPITAIYQSLAQPARWCDR